MKHSIVETDSTASLSLTNLDFLVYGFSGLRENEQFWVAGFPEDPALVPHWKWGGRGGPPGMPDCVSVQHNNYVAVSSFCASPDGVIRRRKANFSHMHMIMVDDVGTKVPQDRIVLPPSAQVETSPGNFQAWYFLTEPEPDPVKADRLIEGMIANGLTADAADPGMRGVTRYGRLPVGVNSKNKYVQKLGHPFVQRVTAWSPSTRYGFEEIAHAYNVKLSTSDQTQSKRRHRYVPQPTGAGKAADEVLEMLSKAGLYLGEVSGLVGAHRVICPWVDEHTDKEPSGTVYFEPDEANQWRGGFKCHHGHCQGRSVSNLMHFLTRLKYLTKA